MKKFLLFLALFSCGFTTCSKTVPSRTESNQLGSVVTVTQTALNDQVSGTNAAIDFVAGKLPESREKEVIQKFTGDQFRLVGFPKLATKTEFEKTAELLLSPDAIAREKGEAARLKLSNENQDLKNKLEQAQRDFEAARKKEEGEHAAALEAARLAGQEAVNRIIAYIFFGASALCMLGAVATLVLASSNPALGPKIAFGLFGAAIVSGVFGVAILQLIKQIERRPSILWIGGGLVSLILAGVGILLYSNHSHHVDKNV